MSAETETHLPIEKIRVNPVAIDFEPGVSTPLPETPLESRDEVREEYGLGFEGDLRAVLQLSPDVDGTDEPAGELYIFDRGEGSDDTPAPLTTNLRDVNRLIRGRYVVMDAKTVDMCRRAVKSGERTPTINSGYRSFNHDEVITVGREDEHFSFTLPSLVSANHLAIGGHVDGSLTVEDLHSTNGTHLIAGERK